MCGGWHFFFLGGGRATKKGTLVGKRCGFQHRISASSNQPKRERRFYFFFCVGALQFCRTVPNRVVTVQNEPLLFHLCFSAFPSRLWAQVCLLPKVFNTTQKWNYMKKKKIAPCYIAWLHHGVGLFIFWLLSLLFSPPPPFFFPCRSFVVPNKKCLLGRYRLPVSSFFPLKCYVDEKETKRKYRPPSVLNSTSICFSFFVSPLDAFHRIHYPLQLQQK